MNNSKKIQRKQKIPTGSHLVEERAELRLKQEAQRKETALSKRESGNDVKVDTNHMMMRILERDNLIRAYKRVKSNKGRPGVDGMSCIELLPHLQEHWEKIKEKLENGTYQPSPVRRVEIPKANGGKRKLGIPTVLDRVIQQAILQELQKVYEPGFSENSYGFRPKRSSHQAIMKAKEYINSGKKWVVDVDIEKFFDKVNHDKLMYKLSLTIKDKTLLKLIRKYLQAGIMENGISTRNETGTPQGGPLSPLLANILLDELDKELDKRGDKYCRYADDITVYVYNKKSGKRTLTRIKKKLKEINLTLNEEKSIVSPAIRIKFLGFSFYRTKEGKAEIRIHEKTYESFKRKVKELTNRNKGISIREKLFRLNNYTRGWINYYRIGKCKRKLVKLDSWIRRRIRACLWKFWKKIKTKYRNLLKLGIKKDKAYQQANTRKGYWRISNSPMIKIALNNKYLEKLGYESISARYQRLCNS